MSPHSSFLQQQREWEDQTKMFSLNKTKKTRPAKEAASLSIEILCTTQKTGGRTFEPPAKWPRFETHCTSCAPHKRDRITRKKNFHRNIGRRSRHPIPPSAPLRRFSLIFTNDLSNVRQRLIDVEHIHWYGAFFQKPTKVESWKLKWRIIWHHSYTRFEKRGNYSFIPRNYNKWSEWAIL